MFITKPSKQPISINNKYLLPFQVIQEDLANCVVIAICNIIEAFHWQQTGKIIQFDYDLIYSKLTKKNIGISFDNIKNILELIDFEGSYKIIFKNQVEDFKPFIKGLLHKHSLIAIGCKPIKNHWNENHAVVLCGYYNKEVVYQSTFKNFKRFMKVGFDELEKVCEIIAVLNYSEYS